MELFGDGIKKPFGRMGGKNLLSSRLLDNLPSNYEELTYIEPFFGGGSLYFKKKPSKKEVINDLDRPIYVLMQGFKKYDGEKIKKDLLAIPANKETFKRIRETEYKKPYDTFLKYLYLTKRSFFQKMTSFSKTKDNFNPDFTPYKNRLKHTIILNEDYKKVIQKYDSKDAIFYLDPPYENSENLYRHHSVDYIELNAILQKLKGKFLLSLNYNQKFIDIFKNFDYKIVWTKYTKPMGGTRAKKTKELLFRNYQ